MCSSLIVRFDATTSVQATFAVVDFGLAAILTRS
jgi:hypothetical protein